MLVEVNSADGLQEISVVDYESEPVTPVGDAFVVVSLVTEAAQKASHEKLPDVFRPLGRFLMIAGEHEARLAQCKGLQPRMVVCLISSKRLQPLVELLGTLDDK